MNLFFFNIVYFLGVSRSSTNAGGRHVSEAKHAFSDGTQDKIAWERTLDGNRGKKTVKERRRGKRQRRRKKESQERKKKERRKKEEEGRKKSDFCVLVFFSFFC